jgi:hypothetical protein
MAIFIGILILAIQLAWPNFFSAFNKTNRKIYLKDAFISFICAFGLFSAWSSISVLLTMHHPSFIGSNTFDFPAINGYSLVLEFLGDTFTASLGLMLIIVGLIYIYNRLVVKQRKIMKYLFLIMIAIPFTLPGELEMLPLLMNIFWFGIILFLIRYFWRFNPIGFLLGAFCIAILPNIIKNFSIIQDPSYRNQMIVVVICMILFFAYFMREIFSSPKVAE